MSERRLFSAFGIELEYMIVDSKRLNVRPIADRLLVDREGEPVSDLEFGAIAWSNELINHVVEFKTNGPATEWAPLIDEFQKNIAAANKRLAAFGARLMPTAMHPWMNPAREMQLWFGDAREIYDALDAVFDCSGHGWCNVQSMHLNLPFQGDDEFGRLHAAVRLLLPLLPALAASSPLFDSKRADLLDARLHFYEHNCDRIPSITAGIIPEAVFKIAEYQESILEPMFKDLAAVDSEGLLQDEFINSRGAIPRFGRSSLEIRLIDVQECVLADLSIAALVIDVLRLLVEETFTSTAQQQSVSSDPLRELLHSTIQSGERAVIEEGGYLAHFGMRPSQSRCTAQEVWQHLLAQTKQRSDTSAGASNGVLRSTAEQIVNAGTLASRIVRACGEDYSPAHLKSVYSRLCDSLAENKIFCP